MPLACTQALVVQQAAFAAFSANLQWNGLNPALPRD
jgi:hypothetical protein